MKRIKKYRWRILLTAFLLSVVPFLIPPENSLITATYSTVMVSREGDLLGARIAKDEQWRFPSSDSLSDKYIRALLAYEDRHFYRHPGINPVSLIRAAWMNAKAGRILSGGSTITMQLARMARGNQPRNLYHKVIEMILAVRIEIYYSKEEILRLYASHAPFGGNVVGVDAASWRYFARSSRDLSWAEAASLAVLPNAPGLIFPGSNDEAFLEKRNKLLETLNELGYLNEMDLRLSLIEELPAKPFPLPNHAPHLLNRVINEGAEGQYLFTSLEIELQARINQVAREYYESVSDREIHNLAVLVTEVETGEVLAYIGNADHEGDSDHGGDVDIITSERSPGSLLKPVLYALSLDEGLLSPQQLLPDVPLFYRGFAPQNFDKKFSGAVPAHRALQSSLNVPFVNLLKDYGYENMHSKLRRMGVRSMDKEAGHYGLTMILGGGELSLWEINTIYSGMARALSRYNQTKGKFRYASNEYLPSSYLVEKKNHWKADREEGFISAGSIWLTLEAMKDLSRPGSYSNWKSFSSKDPIAWKTGTSYGHKDAWSVGLNSKYVVSVWLGNADGEGRPDLVGSQVAAPLMLDVFSLLSNYRKDERTLHFAPVADLRSDRICKESGFRAGEYCTHTVDQFLPRSIQQPKSCPYHKPIYMDQSRTYQVNANCYPVHQMTRENWFILPASQSLYFKNVNHSYREPPKYLAGCGMDEDNRMEVLYPKNRAKLFIPVEIDGSPGKAVFEVAHLNKDTPVYWHLDDEYVGMTRDIHQMGFKPSKGAHKLNVVDKNGNSLQVKFEVIN